MSALISSSALNQGPIMRLVLAACRAAPSTSGFLTKSTLCTQLKVVFVIVSAAITANDSVPTEAPMLGDVPALST
ncbi:hypothetical protein [Glaciimonas immobilis]|uniref:Uncharacterized protein n=1 Tax=Glaciimonas immobilis TaxID=728004 RepID=A0A840RSJ3_9BURK|nr:hypothetical protein [Glaciimonas immobilis]KAF3997802.1 hypothetical protein HAV38_09370 [Glaciimonas immobilis]MBB5199571.1 hypothetical protein [Glaciimonas immobilis]